MTKTPLAILINHDAATTKSPKQQNKFLKSENQLDLITLAYNPNLSSKKQMQLYNTIKDNDYILKILASNPSLSIELQYQIVEYHSMSVKEYLAGNKNIIPEIQVRLACENEYHINFALAKTIPLCPEAQQLIFNYQNRNINYTLVQNPSLVPELFNDLYLANRHTTFFQLNIKRYHNPETQAKLEKAFLLQ